MAKALVIVESPAKAKTINKYLGRDYKVIASMGHVRDLPKSKLGVDVDEDFAPDYVVIPDRAKVIKELKDAAKGVEDTAFYRYFPLCSVNEVGGTLGSFGVPLASNAYSCAPALIDE